MGCHMPFEFSGLMDSVIRRVGSLGYTSANDVGEFLKSSAVVRYDSKRTTKLADLLDLRVL